MYKNVHWKILEVRRLKFNKYTSNWFWSSLVTLIFYFIDSLSPSQFPVFTMYATKICIQNVEDQCSFQTATKIKKKRPSTSILPRNAEAFDNTHYSNKRSWSFDRVHHHHLAGFVRKRLRVRNGREECMENCLSEEKFICR